MGSGGDFMSSPGSIGSSIPGMEGLQGPISYGGPQMGGPMGGPGGYTIPGISYPSMSSTGNPLTVPGSSPLNVPGSSGIGGGPMDYQKLMKMMMLQKMMGGMGQGQQQMPQTPITGAPQLPQGLAPMRGAMPPGNMQGGMPNKNVLSPYAQNLMSILGGLPTQGLNVGDIMRKALGG